MLWRSTDAKDDPFRSCIVFLQVRFGTFGEEGSRKFVLEFNQVPFWVPDEDDVEDGTTEVLPDRHLGADTVTSQLVLNEETGIIEVSSAQRP